jgi:hypothetical protein
VEVIDRIKDADDAEKYLAIAYDDTLAQVDSVARVWGRHQIGYMGVKWYPGADSTCRDASSSIQWETPDEIHDRREMEHWVDAFDGAIEDLRDDLEKAILWAVYANSVGSPVWKRGPFSEMSREKVRALLKSALRNISPPLRRRGVNV